jgi:hypothetical protein
LIHDRNLPKNGTISPFRETKQPPSSLHYMGERRDSTSSHLPPVPTEILIPTSSTTQQELSLPTGKCPTSSSDDNQSWISNTYSSSGHHHHQEQEEQDYKTLYFCSQSDKYRLEQRNASVMEENRLLKRQLFEMQRQLYNYRRNNPFICTTTMTSHKRRKISSNADADAIAMAPTAAAAPWLVPPSNLPQRSGTAGTVSAAAAARQALSQGGNVIVANSSNQRAVIKTPVRSNNQAIRFRRVSVGEGQEGPAAAAERAPAAARVVVAAVQQHLAMPQLTHAISAEEGETMVINNKSG